MSERFKYAKNGICRVENFAEHLAAGIFPRIELGRLCGMKWYSELRIYEDDNEIYPVIWCDNYESEVEHRVQIYLKLENHSEDNNENFTKINKEVLNSKEVFIGFYAPILKILNLKKGWLDDGALSFEYGIQVKAILENRIWTFNFNDKLFDAGAEMFQFERVEDPNTVGPLCTHKLLSHFHSEELVRFGNHLLIKWKDETWHESIIDLLQLCHGVRLDLTRRKWGLVLNDAHGFKMFNVVSYFDWFFVHEQTWENLKRKERIFILMASELNLRHFLAVMIKSMTSLKEFVSEEDVGKMSNESMKMFVAKFLYKKF